MHILYAYNLLRTYHTRHHSKFLTCSNSFVFTSLQRYPFSANTSVLPFLLPALIFLFSVYFSLCNTYYHILNRFIVYQVPCPPLKCNLTDMSQVPKTVSDTW